MYCFNFAGGKRFGYNVAHVCIEEDGTMILHNEVLFACADSCIFMLMRKSKLWKPRGTKMTSQPSTDENRQFLIERNQR